MRSSRRTPGRRVINGVGLCLLYACSRAGSVALDHGSPPDPGAERDASSSDPDGAVSCAQRPSACAGDAAMLVSVDLPGDGWRVLGWDGSALVYDAPWPIDPCGIPADGCAELRVEFDADGCLARTHPPVVLQGGQAQGEPYPPRTFPGLVECTEAAWSGHRWPCLAGRSAVQRETCFE